MIEALHLFPPPQRAATPRVQIRVVQRFHLRFQAETHSQGTHPPTIACRDETLFPGLQINRRRIARSFHIEEKHQILVAERPTRDHQRLALAHPQKRSRLQRTATNPQGGHPGISHQHQIPRPVHPELLLLRHRQRRQHHVRTRPTENHPLEWQSIISRLPKHFPQNRRPVIRPTQAPHEHVKTRPPPLRAP